MFGQDSQAHDVSLGMSCAEPGVGLDDPDGCLPALLIPCFCDIPRFSVHVYNALSKVLSVMDLKVLGQANELQQSQFSFQIP